MLKEKSERYWFLMGLVVKGRINSFNLEGDDVGATIEDGSVEEVEGGIKIRHSKGLIKDEEVK